MATDPHLTTGSTDTPSFEKQAEQLWATASHLLGPAAASPHADLFLEASVHHRLMLRHRPGRTPSPPHRTAHTHVLQGLGVHILGPDDRLGYAWAAHPNGWASAAEQATEAAFGTRSAATAPVPLRSLPPLPLLPADRPGVLERAALLEAAQEAAFGLDDAVEAVSVEYYEHRRHIALVTHRGHAMAHAGLWLALRVAVTRAGPSGSGPVTAYAVAGGRHTPGFDATALPVQAARDALAQAQHRAEAHATPSGPQPVVLAAGWGGVWLHEAAGHLLEADIGGAPPERLGQPCAHPALTLVDDPTLLTGRASAPFDDEGTPAQRTVLVEQGQCRTLLTDQRQAARWGLPATGNGRRQDVRYAPLPRMTNMLLQPGTTAPADLIADLRDGLYVTQVGQGTVWPEADRYAFEIRAGYRIEHGRLGAPVSGGWLTGTCSTALHTIVGLGDDFHLETARGLCRKDGQVVPVSVGMPTVSLHGLQVVDRLPE